MVASKSKIWEIKLKMLQVELVMLRWIQVNRPRDKMSWAISFPKVALEQRVASEGQMQNVVIRLTKMLEPRMASSRIADLEITIWPITILMRSIVVLDAAIWPIIEHS